MPSPEDFDREPRSFDRSGQHAIAVGAEAGFSPASKRDVYLQKISDWQFETGRTGAPPVSLDKKLSNWIQWCRSQYKRGRLPADVAQQLRDRGIALYGPHESAGDRPRGLDDVVHAIREFIRLHRRAPAVLVQSPSERHLAVWLARLQAGVLPMNQVPVDPTPDHHDRLASFFESVACVQTVNEMAADWWILTRSVAVVLNLPALGNRWQAALVDYKLSGFEERLGARTVLRYNAIRAGQAPIPPLLLSYEFARFLSDQLGNAPDARRRVTFDQYAPFGDPLWLRLHDAGFRKWIWAYRWWSDLSRIYRSNRIVMRCSWTSSD